MRTTVTFERDTAAAIEQFRRERGVGVSEAVNELVRRGLRRAPPHRPARRGAGRAGPPPPAPQQRPPRAHLAIEHGIAVCSADTDFARFDGVRWINPLAR